MVALVEKPMEGLIQGPIEMGIDVLEGTGTLYKNLVEGTFGSVEKFTGSVGSGFANMAYVYILKNLDHYPFFIDLFFF